MRQLIRASPRAPCGCNKHPHLRVVLERLLSRLALFATCRTFSSSLERVHLSVAVETVTTGGGSRFRFEPPCDHFWIVGLTGSYPALTVGLVLVSRHRIRNPERDGKTDNRMLARFSVLIGRTKMVARHPPSRTFRIGHSRSGIADVEARRRTILRDHQCGLDFIGRVSFRYSAKTYLASAIISLPGPASSQSL